MGADVQRRSGVLRVIVITGIIFAFSSSALGQQTDKPGATSLQAAAADRLHKAGNDTFAERDYKGALEAFFNELTLRRGMNDRVGEGWALTSIGETYQRLTWHQQALDCFNQALVIFRQLREPAGEARALGGLAFGYRALGQTEKSLECLHSLLPIVHSSEDRQLEGTILGDIGTAYLEIGYRDQAFDYFNRRLLYERSRKNEAGEAGALKSLGLAFAIAGERKKALENYQRALAICVRLKETAPNDSLERVMDELRQEIKKLR